MLTGANVSPQFLQGTCGDVNGAIVNSFLATAWTFLPKTNPVRAQAALLRSILKRPVSNFDGDAAGALWAYKAAIERGSATREGINNALETRLRGLVTPAGRSSSRERTIRASSSTRCGSDGSRLPGQAALRRGLHEEEVAMRAPQTLDARRLRRS